MAVNVGIDIANGEVVDIVSTTLYTVPASSIRTTINQARLVNYGVAPVVVDLYILQPGESDADNFKAVDTMTIGSGDTYLVSEIIGDSIFSGGKITAICDTATSLSFSATGTEFTT